MELEKITHKDNHDIDEWFENFIDILRTDHLILAEGVATEEKQKLYDKLMFGDNYTMAKYSRELGARYFIKQIVEEYLHELAFRKNKPLKLALQLSDSKILVWSVINDNDSETEDNLLIAEAKVNAKYYKDGFYLNSTIIEKSDNLPTPPHYLSIIE